MKKLSFVLAFGLALITNACTLQAASTETIQALKRFFGNDAEESYFEQQLLAKTHRELSTEIAAKENELTEKLKTKGLSFTERRAEMHAIRAVTQLIFKNLQDAILKPKSSSSDSEAEKAKIAAEAEAKRKADEDKAAEAKRLAEEAERDAAVKKAADEARKAAALLERKQKIRTFILAAAKAEKIKDEEAKLKADEDKAAARAALLAASAGPAGAGSGAGTGDADAGSGGTDDAAIIGLAPHASPTFALPEGDIPFVGLVNACGNDCFINSALQGILSDPALVTWLYNIFSHPDFNTKVDAQQLRLIEKNNANKEKREIDARQIAIDFPDRMYGSTRTGQHNVHEEVGRRIAKLSETIANENKAFENRAACIKALKNIFEIYMNGSQDHIPKTTMSPFTTALRALSSDPKTKGVGQGDSSEVYVLLLDALDQFFTIPTDLKVATTEILNCTDSEHKTERPSISMNLQLTAPQATESSIEIMLQGYLEPETSPDFRCSHEPCTNPVTKIFTITPPEKHLVITINRQTFDQRTSEPIKSMVKIKPSERITIGESQYELTAISSHSGVGGSGHWFAYKRGLHYNLATKSFETTSTWQKMNDSTVSPGEPNFAAGDDQVTVCFYSRIS